MISLAEQMPSPRIESLPSVNLLAPDSIARYVVKHWQGEIGQTQETYRGGVALNEHKNACILSKMCLSIASSC